MAFLFFERVDGEGRGGETGEERRGEEGEREEDWA